MNVKESKRISNIAAGSASSLLLQTNVVAKITSSHKEKQHEEKPREEVATCTGTS